MASNPCMDTCKMSKPCGNRYCSGNPKYVPPPRKGRRRPNKGGNSPAISNGGGAK